MHGQANKVSRGWRSASATLAELADSAGELSYTVNGVQKSISLLDETTGDFIGTYATMQKLYEEGWQQMSNLEKANLALTIGNKTQMEVVLSTLNNFAGAEKALDLAINDNNAAWKENERYMESIEAQLNLVKAQFQNFVLGNGGLQNATILLLKFGNTVLEIVNNIGGLKTVLVALSAVLLTINANSIYKTVKSLPDAFLKLIMMVKGYSQALGEAVVGEEALTAKSKVAGISLTNLQLITSALTAGFTILVGVFSAVNSAVEKHNQAIETARQNAISNAQSIKTEISALDELRSKIESEDLTRAQLDSILEKNLDGYDSEKEALDEVTDARQRAIDKIDEERKKKAQSWLDENETQAKSDQENLGQFSGADIGEKWYQDFSKWSRGVGITEKDTDTTALGKYDKAIKLLKDDYDNLSWSSKNYLNHLQEQRNALYEDITVKEQNTATMLYMQGVVEGGGEAFDAYNDFCATSITLQDKMVTSSQNLSEEIKKIEQQFGYTKDQMEEYINANEDLYDGLPTTVEGWLSVATAMREEGIAVGELSTGLQNFTTYVSNVSEAYGVLSNAVKEYDETGGYSLETLNKLIPLMGQYGQMFDIVDGKINIHTEDMYSLIEAEAEKQKAEIRGTAISKLNALEQENSGKKAKESGDKHKDATAGIDENTASLDKNTEAAVKNAQAQALKKGASKDDVKNIIEEMQANIDLIDKAVAGMNTSFADSTKKAAKRASGSHKSSAKKTKDAWLETYKAEKDALESLYKTNVITAEEYAQKLEELSDKYLTDSADHQKKYAKEIHDAYEGMYTALKKSAKEALDEEEKRLKKQLDDIKDEAKAREKDLKRAHDSEEKAIKKKIDTQKEYNKEVLKGIKSQIDALKREKDATKDSYNKRIDTLKTEREEYERQVKLMQLKEELAKAKSTMQYVMDETGKFTYQEDSTAVDQAQENLIEEERKQQYERELSALEDARDNADEIYEQRIQSLEDYYDSVKEQQDKAIDQMEKYLDEVKDRHDQEEQVLSDHYDALEAEYERNYNDFKDNADKYLNGQMQLTNNENSEWGRRLQNLANFVNEYNALMNSLNNGSTSNSSNYKGSSSNGSSIKSSSKKSSSKKSSSKKKASKKSKRASGDASVSSDGMYLVGDSPNQELVIGSKLNGVPLSLSRGDGVVNAKSTNTLAGILNMIGGMAKPLAPNQTNNNSTSNITISNVSLPNVHNGEEFINCLQHFDIDMMQRSYDTY